MTIRLAEERRRAAEILISIQAIGCNLEKPFRLTSGWASPVYVDCRKILSFVRERREIVSLMARNVEGETFDVVAGGETAGIPFGAWVAEALGLPFVYVRKKPKEVGRTRQIEGLLQPGQRVLLVEDLATDGASKVHFLGALRGAGAACAHAAVVFYYGIFPKAPETLRQAGLTLHALTDWPTTLDVAESAGYFTPEQGKGVREFLKDPEGWSRAHGGA